MTTEPAEQYRILDELQRAVQWLKEHPQFLGRTNMFISRQYGDTVQICLGYGVSDTLHGEFRDLFRGQQATKTTERTEKIYTLKDSVSGLDFRWTRYVDMTFAPEEEAIVL
jgi:hypothetical protein